MKDLSGKTVCVGVTGGIAAYKACEVVSQLKKAGAQVHCILTEHACEFVRPLTFEVLSKNPVCVGMFDRIRSWEVEHVSLAQKADLFLIVPATANFIGKVYAGIADDMLTTTVMATKAPVLIAPAMNTGMFENPITQRNIKALAELGYHFVGPASGLLACGDTGAGRLEEIPTILQKVEELLCPQEI